MGSLLQHGHDQNDWLQWNATDNGDDNVAMADEPGPEHAMGDGHVVNHGFDLK